MDNKSYFDEPCVEVVRFEVSDVITTSGELFFEGSSIASGREAL